MIKIPIGDWFIARSEAFQILVDRFREHKKITNNSFTRVKSKHHNYDRKINELNARVKELELILEVLNAPEIKVRTKKRKKR